MAALLVAASPVEIEAKADEANLPDEARAAALRLFHDLTSRLELAAIELEGEEGEEWPRHRFFFGARDGEPARLLAALRSRGDAVEVTHAAPGEKAPFGTLFITGEDGGFAAVLLACDNGRLLNAISDELIAAEGSVPPSSVT